MNFKFQILCFPVLDSSLIFKNRFQFSVEILFFSLNFFFFLPFFLSFFSFFLSALGLCCCTQAFSSCREQGLLFVAVHGLLIEVASLVAEHGLQ